MTATLLSSLVGDPAIARLFEPAAELSVMLRVEAVLAECQAELGLIPGEAAVRIASVCQTIELDVGSIAEGFVRDGVTVPDFVRQLRAAVGPSHGQHVHSGATSQDVMDTGLLLRLREVFDILDARLGGLIDRLDGLSAEEGGLPLMAHTRMQAALPFTVADKLRSWSSPLRRHRGRIGVLGATAFCLQLGGPTGDGTSFGPRRENLAALMAERLGLSPAAPWHSDRDRMADIAQVLTLIAGSLGKIGQDVALMAQNEVGAIRLSGSGSSSAMAHKQNPVRAELLVAMARMTAGLNGIVTQALVHENERSGAAWTLEWMALPQMAELAGAALDRALRLVEGATFAPLR